MAAASRRSVIAFAVAAILASLLPAFAPAAVRAEAQPSNLIAIDNTGTDGAEGAGSLYLPDLAVVVGLTQTGHYSFALNAAGPNNQYVYVQISAPPGEEITLGKHEPITDFVQQQSGWTFALFSPISNCPAATGYVQIDELAWDATNNPTTVAATLVCGDTVVEMRLNSSVPVGPIAALTSSLAFPTQLTGTTSNPKLARMTAVGQAPLHPGMPTITGPDAADFAISTDGCDGVTLAVGDSCELSATFAPHDGTNLYRTATLLIPDDSLLGAHGVLLTGVVRRATTITLSSEPNPATWPDAPTITATVNPPPDGGWIDWFVDGTHITSTWASNPVFTTVGWGQHSVGAIYRGDDGYAPSTAVPLTQTTYTPTRLIINVSPAWPGPDGAFDIDAVIMQPALLASGRFELWDDTTGQLLGAVNVSPQVAADIWIKGATLPGRHYLRATYTGSPPYVLPAEIRYTVNGTTGADPASATHLFVAGLSSAASAGTPGTITVSALSANGDVDADYAGIVHLASSDPLAQLPADIAFTAADAGVKTFRVTLNTAGTQSVSVGDLTTPGIAGSASIVVAASVASAPVKATTVAAGDQHACAVLQDGTVRCWGRNDSGQLGDGTHTDRPGGTIVGGLTGVTALAAGSAHSCALRSDQTVWCWGSNAYGQLGDGTVASHRLPVQVAGIDNATSIAARGTRTCAVLATGAVRCWGQTWTINSITPVPMPTLVAGLPTATAVAVGGGHACVLGTDQSVWCWGNYGHGQVGDGHNDTWHAGPVHVSGVGPAVSVATGDAFSCAALADHSVWCWGANAAGQAGGPDATDVLTPAPIDGVTTATAVTAGSKHACALGDAAVVCWGAGTLGQLGRGTIVVGVAPGVDPAAVVGISTATVIAGGGDHTCSRLADGSIACWGDNDYGQNGDGSPVHATPVKVPGLASPTSLASGWYTACATVDAKVLCWGDNTYGMIGDTAPTAAPVPVTPSNLGPALAVSTGSEMACALLADHTVRCWGQGYGGPLSKTPAAVTGISTATQISVGHALSCALLPDTTVTCWGPDLTSQAVAGLAGVTQVVAFGGTACALLEDRTVDCWGDNSFWQTGSDVGHATPWPVAGLDHVISLSAWAVDACAALEDGSVRCWGAGFNAILGRASNDQSAVPLAIPGITTATSVAVGDTHACAILADHRVRCWGANESGQLGDGTTAIGIWPSTVEGLEAVAVAPGTMHTCAIALDGTVWCWGNDAGGQLGLGHAPFAPAPVKVLLPPAATAAVHLDIPGTTGSVYVPATLSTSSAAAPAVGYLLTESGTKPTASAAWSSVPPTGFTFTHGDGSRTLHGWIRGSDGKISGATAITLVDTTRPKASITGPATTRTRQIAIAVSGSDTGSGVGAWLVSETPSRPLPTDPRWRSSKPTTFVLSDLDGSKSIYAWSRDRAGNVSAYAVTTVLLDRAAPVGLGTPGAVLVSTGAATTTVPLAVSWPKATDDVSGVARYQLAASKDGGKTWISLLLSTPSAAKATLALAPGKYVLRVRAIDALGNASAWAMGSAFSVAIRQQNSSLVTYTGSFTTSSVSGATGGTVAWSSTAGRAVTLRTTGRGFAWISTQGPNRGMAAVYLDGVRVATVDLYASTYRAARIVWRVTFATAGGPHTVKVVVLGQKRAASSGKRVDIDGFALVR